MSVLNILLILHFNMLDNLIPAEVQVVVVLRIEEPVCNFAVLADGEKCEPVGCYAQHQVQDHRFLLVVLAELFEFLGQLLPAGGVQE